MSGLINKAKEAARDALSSDKREDSRTDHSGTQKPSLMDKLDPRKDSDRDHRDDPSSRVGGYGDDRTSSQYTGGAGNTMGSGNQYDDPRSTNTGPHSSNLMNKTDPRVDSDRDGRNNPTSRTGGYGQTQDNTYGGNTGAGHGGVGTVHDSTTHGGTTGGFGGNTGGMGGSTYDDSRSGNAGPHSSSMMNKADPRVDSDRDGRNDPSSRVGGHGNTQDTYGSSGPGGAGYGTGAGNTFDDRTGGGYGGNTGGMGGTTGGMGGNTGGMGGNQYDNPRSTNTGPHSSGMMNQVDPRVDSDRDGRSNPGSNMGGMGQSQQGYGSGGGFSDSTAPGGHHGHHGQHATPGSGNAQRTAGPHDSDLMNKMDPRVDADMDGSKTYGGNKTNY